MIVVGIGSTSNATAAQIGEAIALAQERACRPCDHVAALARGQADAAVCEAARQTGRSVGLLPLEALVARSGDCSTRSAASFAAHGVASVAEAAALAGAGPGSRLFVPRLTCAGVTAAVAVSADEDIGSSRS